MRVSIILCLAFIAGVPPDRATAQDTLTVYPGDTDNSGSVDEFDILPLGFHWSSSGPARDSVTFVWGPTTAAAWIDSSATYADANGDGMVNEFDLFALGFNWGRTHGSNPRRRPGSLYENNAIDESILIRLRELQLQFKRDGNRDLSEILQRALDRLKPSDGVSLAPPHPNPFNGAVRFDYRLPRDSEVELTVYDMVGRPLRRLVRGHRSAGEHRASWDGRDDRGDSLPSGVYFLHLTANSSRSVRRVVLVR